MAYQLPATYVGPYSASAYPSAYAVLLTTTLDMVNKTATGFYSVWGDKASRDAGKSPLLSFSRTVNATGLVNSVQTSADTLVTGGQITELLGSTVVA